MQNLLFSELSDDPYCNVNVNSGAENYAANLMFMVTCDNWVRDLQFHSSIQKLLIPVCPKKALGTNLLNFEKYVFNCLCIYDRFVLFCFSTVNNKRRVF